jgi:hypothetical protein
MNTLALTLALLLIEPRALPDEPGPQQRIWVEHVKIDLGSIYRGEIATGSYPVENRGDSALVISRIQPHCTCTTVALLHGAGDTGGTERERIDLDSHGFFPDGMKITLEPGQTSELIVMVNTTGMPERKFTRSLNIFSDDPVRPDLSLQYSMKVMLPVKVEPRRLDFGELEHGQEKSLSTRLTLAPDLELNFIGTARHKQLKTAVEKISADGAPGVWQLTVSVDGETPPGPFSTVIAVETDHPRIKSVGVLVVGRMRSAVQFEPGDGLTRVLEFGTVEAAAGATRSIQIQNTQPEIPYRIQSVEIDGRLAAQAKSAVAVLEEGRSYTVEVILPAGLEPGKFAGNVIVHADHPTEQLRSIRFRGRIE